MDNYGKKCTCGAAMAPNAVFCGMCGKRWEPPVIQPETQVRPEEKHRCSCCGLVFPKTRKICPICEILV